MNDTTDTPEVTEEIEPVEEVVKAAAPAKGGKRVKGEAEAGTTYLNTTAYVINHGSQSVGPKGLLKITDLSIADKGLMHLISTEALKQVK